MDYSIKEPSKPKVIFEGENKGTYEIDGLNAGYGHTLGNSLRRVILSSIPGAAVTSIKITGISHEFSKIQGIKEDVITILLNIKKLRFKMNTDEPQTAKISASGITEVKAKDIDAPSQLEILNKNEHIASLTSKDAKLEIEIKVEKGLGYVSREELRKGKVDIGTIVLDAIFTPVRRVSYEVENMRIGDRTDYNKLRISIETDGSITPAEALQQSIVIMIKHLKAIVGFHEEEKKEKETEENEEEIMIDKEAFGIREDVEEDKEALKTRIEDIGLPARALNVLTEAGIRTLGGLARKKESDLLELEGVGKKMLEEIKEILNSKGLSLK